jgi:TRAP-type mannitol/chloroaromatic compound transport system permease small subunit
MITFMQKLVELINRFTSALGCAISWLVLAMMLATFTTVLLRYGFGIGSIALQESVTYMHAAVFLLCAGFTLQHNGQVRVDIFYSRFNRNRRAWVDALGSVVLLIPFCVFLIFISWHFVSSSWRILEISAEPGGIPAVFLLKSLIPLGGFTLALQGLAEALRNLLVLMLSTDTQEPKL